MFTAQNLLKYLRLRPASWYNMKQPVVFYVSKRSIWAFYILFWILSSKHRKYWSYWAFFVPGPIFWDHLSHSIKEIEIWKLKHWQRTSLSVATKSFWCIFWLFFYIQGSENWKNCFTWHFRAWVHFWDPLSNQMKVYSNFVTKSGCII